MVKIRNMQGQSVRIIQCEALNFVGKDVIEITKKEDFIYLIGTCDLIYEQDQHLLLISDSIAWTIRKWK